MGLKNSKIDENVTIQWDIINDVEILYNLDELMSVHFIQVTKKPGCNVTPEQLNTLLGSNIPKYSTLDGTIYPYLYCISDKDNLNKILDDNGYKLGFSKTQQIFKTDFSSRFQARPCYTGKDSYFLKLITLK